jgi:outer membrane protein TolC
MKKSFLSVFSILLGFSIQASPTFASIPPDAQAFLEGLPGQVLTPELILTQALQHSDHFRSIQAQLIAIDAGTLQARAPLDTRFFSSIGRTVDETEPTSPFGFSRIEANHLNIGVSRLFETGTELEFNLQHGATGLTLPPTPQIPNDQEQNFFETRARLNLNQNLWQDAFGRTTRLGLEASQKKRSAQLAQYNQAQEEFGLGMLQQYYQAWIFQSQVRSNQENLERRRQLLNITQLRLERGTAERPDLLQVRNAYRQTQTQLSATQQSLGEIWKVLVTSLKFPAHWIEIDPVLVPLDLSEEHINQAKQACDPPSGETAAPVQSPETLIADFSAQAFRIEATQAQQRLAPRLLLGLGVTTNSVDEDSIVTTLSENLRFENPAWTVSLSLQFPLGRSAERSVYQNTKAQEIRAEAQASIAKDALRVNWMNTCSALKQLDETRTQLQNVYLSQLERERLEQQRFRIGQILAHQAIQAGDDAGQSKLALDQTVAQLHLTAWQVKRLNTELLTLIKNLMAHTPSIPQAGDL